VAEDNPVNQKLIMALLDKQGHSAQLAPDGKSALTMLENHPFDVVLMDVFMPVMSGIEAAEAIRARLDDISQIPIIALTASTTADDIARCREAGMTEFLGKPIDPALMADCLHRVTSPGSKLVPLEPERVMATEVDVSTIEHLAAALGPHKVIELIDTFTTDHATRLERMGKAREESDLAALKREVHDLKGTCGNMGFVGLATLAQDVHDACKADDTGLALHKLKGLPALNARMTTWLMARRKQFAESVDT
jgi:CheY-like chemotaxis protein